MNSKIRLEGWGIPALFMLCRLILLITMPLEGLRGYGDFVHFFRLAQLGWPFLDYWVEFPPVFPFISTILFRLASGREHVYDYSLVFLLSLIQTLELALFIRLVKKLKWQDSATWRVWIYFAVLLVLPFGWWYFDAIAVLGLLLGLFWFFENKDIPGALAISLGILTKLFPVLALPAFWRYWSMKKAIINIAIIFGCVGFVYLLLWRINPEYSVASLKSQAMKGSWETIWALVDGNFNTGNFGPEYQRRDPESGLVPTANPSRLPAWLTIIPFLAMGGWLFWRAKINQPLEVINFVGLTFCIFFLWSPGWSPQWVLYLIPLILLGLPEKEAWLFVIVMVLINLLEWPVFLSRGFVWGLWITILVRTGLFLLLGYQFYVNFRVKKFQIS